MRCQLWFKLLHKSTLNRAVGAIHGIMDVGQPKMFSRITRRQLLMRAGATAAAVGATLALDSSFPCLAGPASTQSARRYKIAASDWMMVKRQKPGALPLAKECGLDGVEVDMGPLGKRPDFENNLRDEEFRRQYLASARELGLEISSLAMSAFYGQPFADHPSAARFLSEWIELMPKLGTRVGFLPVITKGDLASDVEVRARVVKCLKGATPAAQKAGVVLGLNTQLTAEQNIRLLDEIGSPSVRIAYNVGEAVDAQRDVYAEIRTLGPDRIAQIIPTLSDKKWLADDERIDVPRLKRLLDEMNWSGWLVLQRSRMAGKKPKENFSANANYLKSIFQAG